MFYMYKRTWVTHKQKMPKDVISINNNTYKYTALSIKQYHDHLCTVVYCKINFTMHNNAASWKL
jgi:hypothetical protein